MKTPFVHLCLFLLVMLSGCVSRQMISPTFPVEIELDPVSFNKALLSPASELPTKVEENIKADLGSERISATIIIGFRLVTSSTNSAEYDAYFKLAYRERRRIWPFWTNERNRWVSLGIQRVIVNVQR